MGEGKMRFFVKCDICWKEFKCEKMRLPSEIMLIEGMDLCKRCRFKYHKRKMELLDELSKEMLEAGTNPKRIQIEYHSRIAFAFASIITVLFGLPLSTNKQFPLILNRRCNPH